MEVSERNQRNMVNVFVEVCLSRIRLPAAHCNSHLGHNVYAVQSSLPNGN